MGRSSQSSQLSFPQVGNYMSTGPPASTSSGNNQYSSGQSTDNAFAFPDAQLRIAENAVVTATFNMRGSHDGPRHKSQCMLDAPNVGTGYEGLARSRGSSPHPSGRSSASSLRSRSPSPFVEAARRESRSSSPCPRVATTHSVELPGYIKN